MKEAARVRLRNLFSGSGLDHKHPQVFAWEDVCLFAEFVIEPMWVSALLVGLDAIIMASRVTLPVSVQDQFKEAVEVDAVEEQIQGKQCKPGFMLSHPEMWMMRHQRPMMLE